MFSSILVMVRLNYTTRRMVGSSFDDEPWNRGFGLRSLF